MSGKKLLQTNGIESSVAPVNDDPWTAVNEGTLLCKTDTPLNDFSRRSRRRAVIEPNSRLAGVISWPANCGLNSSIPN